MGRFMNIDPLSEKYSYQSHYNFSENRVIDARELEGLEAVKLNEGTKNLIIAVQGWSGGNPAKGHTQIKSENVAKNSFSRTLMEAYGSRSDTQVAVFSASMNSRTPDDISKSIQDFRKMSPDGKLVVAGHSMGGDIAVNIANDNPTAKVDKLITLDISDIGISDNQISSNVVEAKNYFQTNSSIGGAKVEAKEGNSTSIITNVKTTVKTEHKTIDNDYRFNVLQDVKKVIP
jgi:predicted alpha/beta-fold hydrolase